MGVECAWASDKEFSSPLDVVRCQVSLIVVSTIATLASLMAQGTSEIRTLRVFHPFLCHGSIVRVLLDWQLPKKPEKGIWQQRT